MIGVLRLGGGAKLSRRLSGISELLLSNADLSDDEIEALAATISDIANQLFVSDEDDPPTRAVVRICPPRPL